MLDLLADFEVTATFFVVADVVEHYPGLVGSIVERGHEIACHGLHHACKIDPNVWAPRLMYWLKDPDYIFWLGTARR